MKKRLIGFLSLFLVLAMLLAAIPMAFAHTSSGSAETETIKVKISIPVHAAVAGVELEFLYTPGLKFVQWEKSADIRTAGSISTVKADGTTKTGIFNASNRYGPENGGTLELGYLVFEGTTVDQSITVEMAKYVRVINKNTTESTDVTDTLNIDLSMFTVSGTPGVEYSTPDSQPLTVSEADFEKFWDEQGMSGDLSYIQFTALPDVTEGTLFTDTDYSKATASHKFYTGSYTAGTNRMDLGSLTFGPRTIRKHDYTVRIPFTAYGKSGGSVKGYLTFQVAETGTQIIRGDFDGDGLSTVADAVMLTQYLADSRPFGYLQFVAADLDMDEEVAAKDATILARRLVGLPDQA